MIARENAYTHIHKTGIADRGIGYAVFLFGRGFRRKCKPKLAAHRPDKIDLPCRLKMLLKSANLSDKSTFLPCVPCLEKESMAFLCCGGAFGRAERQDGYGAHTFRRGRQGVWVALWTIPGFPLSWSMRMITPKPGRKRYGRGTLAAKRKQQGGKAA